MGSGGWHTLLRALWGWGEEGNGESSVQIIGELEGKAAVCPTSSQCIDRNYNVHDAWAKNGMEAS